LKQGANVKLNIKRQNIKLIFNLLRTFKRIRFEFE